nr:g-type lectin s-receptor-like serine/threonine-protein kinase [Quercus suber]
MGFFSPVNSTNRYLGIWYNKISAVTYLSVVWVANRERPLKDSSGVLTINEDGNLVVLNGQAEILWLSNVSNSVPNSSATLLDSGNLVLQGDTTGAIVWESFQHPCDTVLPRMKLGNNLRTNQKIQLTSWKSPSDPSTGRFSAGINSQNIPQVYDKEEIVYATFAYVNQLDLTKHFLDSQGNLKQLRWDDGKEDWEVFGFALANECDFYGTCGAFGSCYALSSPICSCLKGFEPKIVEEWNRGNWMSGCVRRTPLQCERVNNRSEGGGKGDWFLKLEMVKVPDFAEWSYGSKDDCRKQCLENCSCVAYAYDTGIGCMSWSGNLIDLQKFSTGGLDIYIRLSYLEFVLIFTVPNWMSGCVRRTPLQCERVNNRSEGGGKGDWFLKLEMVKVPDFAEWSYGSKDDCRKQCLENCSCVAYAYDTGIGCMSWSGNLIDLQKFSTGGLDIYIRLSYLEFVLLEPCRICMEIVER